MSYDMIDRFLRNNLHDDDYAEYSAALDAVIAAERERCIAECKAVAADVTDAAKMGALECWRRLALGA